MNNKLLILSISMVLLAGCTTNPKQMEPEPRSSASYAAYNAARNQGERNGPTSTSGGQGENTADREITTNVRMAIFSDGSLSLDAQDVMIITTGGMVTLCGPVKSQVERAAIEAKTWQVPGVVQINNQLEVVAQ